jgi:glyoxylase-like metal-dependent hydrolase (beta-lactamase superfamily II)
VPHYFWKDEWDFWTSEEALGQLPEMMAEPARVCLPPLRDPGFVETVDRETEVLPGVRLFPAPGHTPGHAAVAIASGEDRALFFADAVIHWLYVEHPEWLSRYEAIPDQTVETRRELLERAAAEGATALAFHIPGLWRVERSGDGYRFAAR